MKDVLTVVREPSTWHIDEFAHAGPEHLDPEYVAAYDQKSPTDWSEDVAELRALSIGPASTVVDIGAGTGAFARAVAPHVARVIGVDVSEAMVVAMLDQGVEAVRGGFLSYEHEGKPPDAVFTRNGFITFPTSGKLPRSNEPRGCSDLGAYFASETSFIRSSRAKRTRRSLPGSPQPPKIPRKAGRPHNSRSTSAENTRPTLGYSSRCSCTWALRSANGG